MKVATRSDVSEGEVRVFSADGVGIALANVGGEFYALADVCTHDGGPLGEGALWGEDIECPRHGARFDVKTGRVRALPAVLPVRTYPVQLNGDEVLVDVG
ncbi:MAG: Rieske 2Fe-2S domain-containing protein [Dehalococcoidia bacterium]|nr:Rieske 2Fe-2S domain-containing protein [Dehalococcoidia bacterium]